MTREDIVESLFLSIDDRKRPFESKVMREAIKLLKADAPRVLTLEELMGFDGMFLIEYNPDNLNQAPDWASFFYMDNRWVYLFKERLINHYSKEQYGRTWRCWSRRPDRKQMEATPWPGA